MVDLILTFGGKKYSQSKNTYLALASCAFGFVALIFLKQEFLQYFNRVFVIRSFDFRNNDGILEYIAINNQCTKESQQFLNSSVSLHLQFLQSVSYFIKLISGFTVMTISNIIYFYYFQIYQYRIQQVNLWDKL
ncbi:hypothetical protein pb186bvf_007977 [Paramecium bursaria]